jgi:DNA-binding IclR family transcriptional regulator
MSAGGGTERVLDVLQALCGYAANGASNSELAAAARLTPTQITRAIDRLAAKGWARKDETNGRFYPTPLFARLSFDVLADFERLEARVHAARRAMTGL